MQLPAFLRRKTAVEKLKDAVAIGARNVVANYDAGSVGRRTKHWKAPATDAAAAVKAGGLRLIYVSRDFIRNNWIANRAQQVVAANIVGRGIKFSAKAATPEIKQEVEDLAARHLGSSDIDATGVNDIFGLQELATKSMFSDGGVLVRRRWRTGAYGRGLALPFQIELIEIDHLDRTLTGYGGNVVIDGVELSPTGAPVAYHILPEHPGSSAWRLRRPESVRVPAIDIIYLRRIDRVGQIHGVPWLAPVMLKMSELAEYQEAEIVKQRMAAMLTAIVTHESEEPAATGSVLGYLEAGAVAELGPGHSVTFSNPPRVESYDVFQKAALRAIAAGIGITAESLSVDLEGVNYSSGRMGRLDMDANVASWQSRVLIGQFCTGVARWFREAVATAPDHAALARGEWSLLWTPPRRPLVDPSKEITAAIAEIDAGLTSRQRKQRELGYDPDEIRREREEDAARDPAPLPPPAPSLAEPQNNEDSDP